MTVRPVLSHPRTAVVGATNVWKMAAFLSVLGMRPRLTTTLPKMAAQHLYGLETEALSVEMETPNSDRTIQIVETPNTAYPFRPLVAGPYGLDFNTRDITATVEMTRAAGGHNYTRLIGYGQEPSIHPDSAWPARYEMLFQGPDELSIYETEVNLTADPYPSLLDRHPAMVNSEFFMLCWVIEHRFADREPAFWVDEAGLEIAYDGFPLSDGMVELMHHPRPTPLRCTNIVEGDGDCKIELMSYPDEDVDVPAQWPLRGGFFAARFAVRDLTQAMRTLQSARFGEVVEFAVSDHRVTAVTALSPGNVRFELWQLS